MEPQLEPNHYFNKSYDSKECFISYWHQINEIIKLNPKRVLEIGIGNSFISKYLKERRINIITLDIDKRLNPDVVGNVLDIPFTDESFDIVACYELLEHLTYEDFHRALSEISRVSNSYAILSLPDVNKVYRLYIQIPKIGYPLDRITNNIKKQGFNIERTYRIFEHPYHRFFILKKIERE